MVIVEKLVEWRLAGETDVLGENLPRRHFVHHKSHLPRLGLKPGRRCGKPATNRLTYGTASPSVYVSPLMLETQFHTHTDSQAKL
jgi:hypothetical protein